MSALRQTCIAIVLLLAFEAQGRLALVAFPLVNEDTAAPELSQWASCVPAECFSRIGKYVPGLQVWETAFIFPVDSSGWRLESDSLVRMHQQRWNWDLAVGGSYRTSGDTVSFTIRAVRMSRGRLARRSFTIAGTSVTEMMMRLLIDFFNSVDARQIGRNAAEAAERVVYGEQEYRTYVAGYRYEVHGNYQAAASAYNRAFDMSQSLAMAALRLGALYARAREFELATHWFAEAAGAAPNDEVIAGRVALHKVSHGAQDKAEAYVSGRRALLQQSVKGLTALGVLHYERGEYQRAVALLTRALAMGPSDLESDLALGRAYLAAGNFAMAADVFNRLVGYHPDNPRYYSFLGAAYRSSGRLMESVRALTIAYELHPENIAVSINLAGTCFDLGRLEEAERLLTEARKANPDRVDVSVNLAVVYWKMGKREKAHDLLEHIEGQERRTQVVLNTEAGMALAEGRQRDALDKLRQARKTGGKHPGILYNLGYVSMLRGKYQDALKWFDEVHRLSPGRLDVLLLKADIAVERGELKAAEEAYRQILSIAPHNEDAVRSLARTLVALGRKKDAANVLERYLNDFPTDARARLTLAEIYIGMEWYEVARHHFELVARDHPHDYRALIGWGKSLYGLVVYKDRQEVDKAVTVLKKAQVAGADRAEPDYLLGCLYMLKKDEQALAREHLNRALSKADETSMRKKIRQAAERVGH